MNAEEIGPALDAWIEAMPQGRNDRCPCGCGEKWKNARREYEKHERKFIENFLKEKQ